MHFGFCNPVYSGSYLSSVKMLESGIHTQVSKCSAYCINDTQCVFCFSLAVLKMPRVKSNHLDHQYITALIALVVMIAFITGLIEQDTPYSVAPRIALDPAHCIILFIYCYSSTMNVMKSLKCAWDFILSHI